MNTTAALLSVKATIVCIRLDVGVDGNPSVRAGPGGAVRHLRGGWVGESRLMDGRQCGRHGRPQGRNAFTSKRMTTDCGFLGLLDVSENISEFFQRYGLDLPSCRRRERRQ